MPQNTADNDSPTCGKITRASAGREDVMQNIEDQRVRSIGRSGRSLTDNLNLRWIIIVLVAGLRSGAASPAVAHDGHGHAAATYEVTAAADIEGPHLRLTIVDDETGEPTAARFSLTVDGEVYEPSELNEHGLRFTSIHQAKDQTFVVTYSRGTGEVQIPLPERTRRGTVAVVKGFEYLPMTATFEANNGVASVNMRLRRWSDLAADGWRAADEHLHYERTDPDHDRDWLAMLAGDDLSHAHFMVLRGGNLQGVWAEQFAYGAAGEGTDGKRLIRPGEEYRDGSQGHINLLGIDAVIPPMSTGGIGEPRIPFNYPPLLDVFRRTHELGGIGGPAHGASLARSSTAVLDTVLGEVDFFEIANTHLSKTDVWYRLMNCGYILPPAAGTDLPNFPFREAWQPFLGEIRMYVQVGEQIEFASWTQAVLDGKVLVSSGPAIQFAANDVGPGGVVQLPAAGGEVELRAVLSSPRSLETLEIVQMGRVQPFTVERENRDGIQRLQIRQRLRITESCWLAARGSGGPKLALIQNTDHEQNTFAHTGAIKVLVGEEPIQSAADMELLIEQLEHQREYYRTEATYAEARHRLRFVELFDEAIERLDAATGEP